MRRLPHAVLTRVPALASAQAGLLLFAGSALGQQRQAPPTPPAADGPGSAVFLYYLVIVVLGGATIAVSVMPGKRSHQE